MAKSTLDTHSVWPCLAMSSLLRTSGAPPGVADAPLPHLVAHSGAFGDHTGDLDQLVGVAGAQAADLVLAPGARL